MKTSRRVTLFIAACLVAAGCGGTAVASPSGSTVVATSSLGQASPTPSSERPATSATPIATATPVATPDPLDAVRHPMTDLAPPKLQAKVFVDHSPDWQVAAFGSVWVATGDGATVVRIDPKTDKVVASVPVGAPCLGMGAGFGSVWVPDCSTGHLVRVDPSTNKAVASIAVQFSRDGEGQIAVGAGAVWVPDPSGILSRLDPATSKVSATFQVGVGLAAVAFGFGSIWGTIGQDHTVVRVSPTGKVVATVPVARGPRFLAAGPTGIWVLGQQDGDVSRIDPATNQVSATVRLEVPGNGGCIATGGGSVWVTMPRTPVSRIDATTAAVLEQYQGAGGDCIGYAFDSVWLSNHDFGDVWRIKP